MKFHGLMNYFNFRTLGLLLSYALLCGISYFVAFQLRFDFYVPGHFHADMVRTIWWVVGLKLAFLFAFGQVDCVLSYFRLSDVIMLFVGLLIVSIFLVVLWYVYGGAGMPPRAVILTDFQLGFLLLAGFRIALRVRASSNTKDWLCRDPMENVIIVGAGEVGAAICSELKSKARFGMRPVALLDDDPSKNGRYVHGVLVAGPVNELPAVARRYAVRKIIMAFPSAPVCRVREVVDMARALRLPVESVPAMTDLISGRSKIMQLHPIEMADLLGRKAVDLDSDKVRAMLSGKRVLITGAGGSIGCELVAQIIGYAPAALLCVDQAEIAIFNLRQEILQRCDPNNIARTQVLDICENDELEAVFSDFKPEIIFHAAAHKHVNLMESQPGEALRNNFFATVQLARLASRSGTDQFILVSTDKAINPCSVMGASKRLAELALLEQQQDPGNQTRFMAVRFGNVLGSSGSVIQIFKRQLDEGGPLTVTDPEASRFFMTVREAVGLILQSATQGSGGEIFVLDMGEPIKIINIARHMIALSGYEEGKDIEIEITGLKPGEKLREEVQHLSETLQPTDHPQVMRFVVHEKNSASIDLICEELKAARSSNDSAHIKRTIQKYVPEYTPYLG